MDAIQTTDAYGYQNLTHPDSIRLLYLEPHNDPDSLLQGSLIDVRLGSLPEFEALSYAWGSEQSLPNSILLDSTLFSISDTLSAALHIFRLDDKPRVLWIDVICINQKDNDEKSAQVAQMSEIYTSAAHVLIWLGESTDWTSEVLQFLRNLSTSDRGLDLKRDSQGPGWFTFGSRKLHCNDEDAMAIIESTRYPRLDHIFGRSWFTRLWIIQEIALAKSATLFCGHETIEWSDFAISLCVLKAAMNSTRIGIAYLHTFQTAWHVVDVKATLLVAKLTLFMSPYSELAYFLDLVKAQQCQDDRDRIYALLGIGLFHFGQEAIVPDYSKSKEEVYRDVARHCVSKGDLFILHHAGLWRRPNLPLNTPKGVAQEYILPVEPESKEYLPTWVPDFSTPHTFTPLPFNTDNFCAGLRMSLGRVALDPHSSNRIIILGKIIDIVSRRMVLPNLASCSNQFDAICNLVEHVGEIYVQMEEPNGWELPMALMADGAVRSLNTGTDIPAASVPVAEVLEMWGLFLKHCLQEDGEIRLKISALSQNHTSVLNNEIEEGLTSEAQKAFRFYNALCDVFETCQFVISADGLMGLMPLLAEVGDSILLVPGLHTPYVLRKVGGREEYVVVGPCYVRGIMSGEVVEGTLSWDEVALI